MRIDNICNRLHALGALPVHTRQVLRMWSQALPQDSGRRAPQDFLPWRVRRELPALEAELRGLAQLLSAHPADDGSARLLVGLHDGQSVECVLLPRGGVCVSTQVGCAVGCVFCMTGQGGLVRQLGSAEIVAQVVLARQRRSVKKVVFMGMGEPAHNLDNVMAAIELLGTAGGIGHKNLVFSTVGDRRAFERLPQGRVKPALALSLHSTQPALRRQLLPRAPDIDPAELVALGDDYARATGYPMQVQWTLLAGINDGQDELDGLVRLLSDKRAIVNLIAYNAVDGLAFVRPSATRASDIATHLSRRGVLTRLRQSAGQEVDAGCGQLRVRVQPQPQPLADASAKRVAPSASAAALATMRPVPVTWHASRDGSSVPNPADLPPY